MMSLGLCSTSDAIAFDQNSNNLGLTSGGQTNLSNDIKIKVLGSMEPEIWMKIIKNWSVYDDAFSSPVEDQSQQQ